MEMRAGTKVVGRVTSAVFSSRKNSHIALAMIKRGYNEPGMSLVTLANGAETTVRVVGLPFGDLPSL
jgi:glycine cleavage system aminomethyltransferase T